jgi:hypothetical protein
LLPTAPTRFSVALNERLVRFAVVSTAAPLTPSACWRRSAAGWFHELELGLGSILRPSALKCLRGNVRASASPTERSTGVTCAVHARHRAEEEDVRQ